MYKYGKVLVHTDCNFISRTWLDLNKIFSTMNYRNRNFIHDKVLFDRLLQKIILVHYCRMINKIIKKILRF